MAIDRRAFLGGLASAPFVLSPAREAIAAERVRLFAGARKDGDGSFSAAVFDFSGDVASVALPARGHDVAARPGGGEWVFFARRPGRFAVALREAGGPTWFAPTPDRHFYGHGVFSPDGRLLYTTENNYDGARGVIGVRDATDGYRRIGEFPSGGVGPHQLALLSDGATLVVANGGMETHPDFPRQTLNLATMAPNIAYLDIENGDLLESHGLTPALHQLSIRHLAVAAGDTVVFGCQYQGPAADLPPLVGFHRRGAEPVVVHGAETTLVAMRNYVGSVVTGRSGAVAALSAPRGGLVTYWDVASRSLIGTTELADACGIAPLGRGFLLSSGGGTLEEVTSSGTVTADHTGADRYAWDNHLISADV